MKRIKLFLLSILTVFSFLSASAQSNGVGANNDFWEVLMTGGKQMLSHAPIGSRKMLQNKEFKYEDSFAFNTCIRTMHNTPAETFGSFAKTTSACQLHVKTIQKFVALIRVRREITKLVIELSNPGKLSNPEYSNLFNSSSSQLLKLPMLCAISMFLQLPCWP